MTKSSEGAAHAAPTHVRRRSFLVRGITMLLGALAALPPLVAGMLALFDPLRRKAASNTVEIIPLAALPADGKPHFYPVVADRVDAWTLYPGQRIGGVYLIRQADSDKVIAYSAICPHLGCSVGYNESKGIFICPCHTSKFHVDGTRVGGESSVAPRDLDSLEVEIKPAAKGKPSGVFVKYEAFKPAIETKEPA